MILMRYFDREKYDMFFWHMKPLFPTFTFRVPMVLYHMHDLRLMLFFERDDLRLMLCSVCMCQLYIIIPR